MTKSFIKKIIFLMFAVFMVNGLALNLNNQRFAHDLDHSKSFAKLALVVVENNHQHDAKAFKDGKAPNAAEHHLLHAVDHIQLYLNTDFLAIFPSLHEFPVLFFITQVIPLTNLDAPFRPPRF